MFIPIKKDNGYLPAMEYLPSKASESYKRGELLVLSAGGVTKCGATTKPQYVCQEDYTAPATGNRRVLVMPVSPFITYQTTTSAAMADGTVDAGNVVTIDADGLRVTATTTNGIATLIDKAGASSGAKVFVKFL